MEQDTLEIGYKSKLDLQGQHVNNIISLTKEFGQSIEHGKIVEIYNRDRTMLESTATVPDYIPLFAYKNAREELKLLSR